MLMDSSSSTRSDNLPFEVRVHKDSWEIALVMVFGLEVMMGRGGEGDGIGEGESSGLRLDDRLCRD